MVPGECWNCGQWLSGGDLLEGYCWNCKHTVSSKDGGYPDTGGKSEESE